MNLEKSSKDLEMTESVRALNLSNGIAVPVRLLGAGRKGPLQEIDRHLARRFPRSGWTARR